MSVRFGFLKEPTTLTWSDGKICPLGDHPAIVAGILNNNQAYQGWFHNPIVSLGRNPREPNGPVLVPKEFDLPVTHTLQLVGADQSADFADFLIALFGMLKGLRLQREGWQHFYKTPLDCGKLCDFGADDHAITQALEYATRFWHRHPADEARKMAFGALHWHLFAQLYEHEFERFNAQYTALDTCYKLALATWPRVPSQKTPHAKRAALMCGRLKVTPPPWVLTLPGKNTCELAERRNALVHEAIYGGAPIGFAHPPDHGAMELGLRNLVARMLLCLLGIDNSYTASDCMTQQRLDFAFP